LSFHDLRERPWEIFCERGIVEKFDTDEWALSEDLDKKRVFVELLNKCLDTRLRKHACSYNKQYDCYCIWAPKDLQKREFSYRSYSQRTRREVFTPYESRTTEGRIAYYRHSAFMGNFLKIENKYTKRLKTPVTLNHKKHAVTIACVECHHEWKKEKGKEPQKCAKCHQEKEEGKELGLKKAYHTTCQGCHKTLAAQGKKAGPAVKCVDCHPKEK